MGNKKANQRKAQPAEITQVQFDRALEGYCINLKSLKSVVELRDEKIKAIMAEYASQIENLSGVQTAQFETLKNFCLQNRDSLFSDKKKSFSTAFAILGIRKDTPSVVLVKGKKWADAIKLLQEKLPDYIKTTVEVNKSEILAKRDEIGIELAECGVKIKQEERFFITPLPDKKKEEAPLVQLDPNFIPSTPSL